MKSKATVEINGQKYTLITDKNTDHILRVGAYVNLKISEIAAQHPTASTTESSVLAALFIAEELLLLRDEHNAMDERIAKALVQNNMNSSKAQSTSPEESEKQPILSVSNQITNKASSLFSGDLRPQPTKKNFSPNGLSSSSSDILQKTNFYSSSNKKTATNSAGLFNQELNPPAAKSNISAVSNSSASKEPALKSSSSAKQLDYDTASLSQMMFQKKTTKK